MPIDDNKKLIKATGHVVSTIIFVMFYWHVEVRMELLKECIQTIEIHYQDK